MAVITQFRYEHLLLTAVQGLEREYQARQQVIQLSSDGMAIDKLKLLVADIHERLVDIQRMIPDGIELKALDRFWSEIDSEHTAFTLAEAPRPLILNRHVQPVPTTRFCVRCKDTPAADASNLCLQCSNIVQGRACKDCGRVDRPLSNGQCDVCWVMDRQEVRA